MTHILFSSPRATLSCNLEIKDQRLTNSSILGVFKYNSLCYWLTLLYIMLSHYGVQNWSIFFLLLHGVTSSIYWPDVFLMIRVGLWALGRKTTEAIFYPSCQGYRPSAWLSPLILSDTWLIVSTVTYRVHLSNSLRMEYLHTLPGVLLQERISSSPLFINSSHHFLIISMDSRAFILYFGEREQSCVIYYVAQIVPVLEALLAALVHLW